MRHASAFAVWAVLLAGCVGMQPPQAEGPAIYVLDAGLYLLLATALAVQMRRGNGAR